MPENLPAHAELWADLRGKPQASKDDHPLEPGVRFNGLQGQLWSETIRSDAQVELHAVPAHAGPGRAGLARGELGAPYVPGKGYDPTTGAFTDQMRAAARRRLDHLRQPAGPGANWRGWTRRASAYRIPTVGTVVEGGRAAGQCRVPGLPIEYRVEGGAWRPYVAGRAGRRAGSRSGPGRPTARRAGRSLFVE